MPSIHLTSFICAPRERVYDLTRNMSVYKKLFDKRKEEFKYSSTSRLLENGESIVIVAKHLWKRRAISLQLGEADKSNSFRLTMSKGDLTSYSHLHHFKSADNGTFLIDMVEFGWPVDFTGRLLGKLYFRKYLEALLQQRNAIIKDFAETEKWKAIS
jgi:ligand-binding SRPBCC domain-containing protein